MLALWACLIHGCAHWTFALLRGQQLRRVVLDLSLHARRVQHQLLEDGGMHDRAAQFAVDVGTDLRRLLRQCAALRAKDAASHRPLDTSDEPTASKGASLAGRFMALLVSSTMRRAARSSTSSLRQLAPQCAGHTRRYATTVPKLTYFSAWFCPFAHRATLALEHHAGAVPYEWEEVRGMA
jgi:hypothetical protein